MNLNIDKFTGSNTYVASEELMKASSANPLSPEPLKLPIRADILARSSNTRGMTALSLKGCLTSRSIFISMTTPWNCVTHLLYGVVTCLIQRKLFTKNAARISA